MEQEETKQDPIIDYPSLVTRVQSNAIDGALILVVMFSFAAIVGDNDSIPGWTKALMFVSFWLLYEPICTAYAVTLENYMMGIRVRNIHDYTRKISLRDAFARVLVKGVLGGWSFFPFTSTRAEELYMTWPPAALCLKLGKQKSDPKTGSFIPRATLHAPFRFRR
jgi:uncharacterized RDD family membrane protein YckC